MCGSSKLSRGGLFGERGGAVVEFAMATGVLALLVMWSHVFFDIIQVRMKTLEAARTALFEFTAYPLSDFEHGTQTSHDKRFKDAADAILLDVRHLYEKDLDSAYQFKRAKHETKRLTLDDVSVKDVRFHNASPYTMQMMSLLHTLLQTQQYRSFNKKGFVSAEAQTDLKSSFVPTQFKFGKTIAVTPMTKHLRQTFYMLVDSWKLEDGCNVVPSGNYETTKSPAGTCRNIGSGGESLLHQQVNRMAYLGFKPPGMDRAGGLLGGNAMDPFSVRTASINFLVDGSDSNIDPSLKDGQDGRTQLNVDSYLGEKAEDKFYTAPFCDEGPLGGVGPCSGPYLDAFTARANYFMGCPKAEYDGKWDCEYTKVGP